MHNHMSEKKSRVWARSGCARCKQRKKKCDEGKPRCEQCMRLGLDCSYDSIWKTPATQTRKPLRKRKTSLSGPLSPKAACTFHVDDTTSADAVGLHLDLLLDREAVLSVQDGQDERKSPPVTTETAQTSMALCIAPSPTASPLVDPDYANYLVYYTDRLSRLLVMVDTACNPLRNMIIPRMLSSPMLLKAVCAVSACHLSQRQETSRSAMDSTFAVRNYSQALHAMTQCLTRYSAWDQDSVDHVVLTAVFLCKYEIIRGSISEWRHHLTGLLHLMNHSVTIERLSAEAKEYLQSFITYHCQVATITLGRNDMSSLALDVAGHDGELDTYMGFTRGIVELFGRISSLSRVHEGSDSSQEAMAMQVAFHKLQSWSIDSTAPYPFSHGVSESSIQCLQSAAIAYHASAIIYFYSVVGSLPMPCLSDGASVKSAATMHCFDALCSIPEGMPSESALVLPLFIMGCEAELPEQQSYAIQRLRKMESTIGLGNIRRARAVVERVQASSHHHNSSRSSSSSSSIDMQLWPQRGQSGPQWSRATDSLGWDLIVT